MDRKLLLALRAVLRKGGFGGLTVVRSTHTLSLVGTKGQVRVTVHFSDGQGRASGFQLNPAVPAAHEITARPHLGPMRSAQPPGPGAAPAAVMAESAATPAPIKRIRGQ
jgi:hypothetical protein